ncbi:ABC transporter ATP-binding protein [Streptomyces javensis]|uniref:ABC transporter ATP-binding protein n=1 Tax=Streptomyces javensis TaxID=114698 RepID=UPI0033E804B4
MPSDDEEVVRTVLELHDVRRDYGDRTVVRSATLGVPPGQCVALVGDNGSGKSTLLRVAAGREPATSGEVLFCGAALDADSAEARTRIATVMDAGAFYPDLTVREHLMLVALAHGMGSTDADAVIERTLKDHRLTDHADALPTSLSSGQSQALLLSAAFVRPHDVLILDEPEQRLDAQARADLVRKLANHRDQGATILVATHHQGISSIANRTYRLRNGVLEPLAGGHAAEEEPFG